MGGAGKRLAPLASTGCWATRLTPNPDSQECIRLCPNNPWKTSLTPNPDSHSQEGVLKQCGWGRETAGPSRLYRMLDDMRWSASLRADLYYSELASGSRRSGLASDYDATPVDVLVVSPGAWLG